MFGPFEQFAGSSQQFVLAMASYPDDIQFAGLVEAATAAADAHQLDLGKRKRGEENAYTPVSANAGVFVDQPKASTLINSAAVLFREPSEKSKKYSRPPLGKVFTSLELSPETFLQLQNAAKDYMLSEEHPERKDVVGHKKQSGNNDNAKLKLYQCVEGFLQQDNNGENYFGHASNVNEPDAPPRTFFWPEDRNRIIKLLMPLLRKMVTNERQRVYAAETRKGDSRKVDNKTQRVRSAKQEEAEDLEDHIVPEIDPSLQPDFHTNGVDLENGASRRIMPELVVSPEDAGSLEQFVDTLRKNIDVLSGHIEVKALLPSGLTPLSSEDDWIVSQMTVMAEVWMNGQLMIVVEV
ncbi:hypothetical protein LTS08_000366 [Lithohypha guttulata]|nr:hypothetical protein LTS08_000366 [Lithohypha guttulata]